MGTAHPDTRRLQWLHKLSGSAWVFSSKATTGPYTFVPQVPTEEVLDQVQHLLRHLEEQAPHTRASTAHGVAWRGPQGEITGLILPGAVPHEVPESTAESDLLSQLAAELRRVEDLSSPEALRALLDLLRGFLACDVLWIGDGEQALQWSVDPASNLDPRELHQLSLDDLPTNGLQVQTWPIPGHPPRRLCAAVSGSHPLSTSTEHLGAWFASLLTGSVDASLGTREEPAFATVSEHLEEAVLLWDLASGRLIHHNPAALRVLDPTDPQGPWPDAWTTHVAPYDLERVRGVLASPYPSQTTFNLHRADQALSLQLRTVPLDDEGGRMAGFFQDVTERQMAHHHLLQVQDNLRRRIQERSDALRASEQRFEALANTINVAVLVFDHLGMIQYANPAATSTFGFDPTSLSRDALVDRLKARPSGLLQLVRSRGVQVHREITIERNGETIYLDVHAARLPHSDELVLSATDVTRRHDDQAEQRDRFDEVSRDSRAAILSEMASSLGHELNQPLTAILAYAQGCLFRMEQSSLDDEDMQEAIEAVASEAKRAGEIVQRLRALFRRQAPEITETSLQELVREVFNLHTFDFRRHHIEAELEIDESVPELRVDARQVELALINLVRNAIHAMTEGWDGPRRLVMGVRRQEEHALLFVSDSGTPVDPATTPRMYDSFFTTRKDGTGMGLFITRTIAERHGGSLWFEVERSGAKSFFLSIPLRSA